MMKYITDKNHISIAPLYEADYLSHGIQWGKHRYVRREGSVGNWRYIYPEDLKKAGQNLVTGAKNLVSNAGNAVGNVIGTNQRKAYQQAQGRANAAWASLRRSGQEGLRPSERGNIHSWNTATRAQGRAANAYADYMRTPLGAAERAAKSVGDKLGFNKRRDMQKKQGQLKAAEQRLNSTMNAYDGSQRMDRAFSDASRNYHKLDEEALDSRVTYRKTPLGKAEQAAKDAQEFIKSIPDEIKYQVKYGIPYDVNHFIDSTVGVQSRRNLVAARNEYNAALEAYKNAAIAAGTRTGNSYFVFPVDSESRAIVNRLDSAFDKVRDARRAYGKSWLGSMEKLLNTNLMKYSWY